MASRSSSPSGASAAGRSGAKAAPASPGAPGGGRRPGRVARVRQSFAQVGQVYALTKGVEPAITWWLLLAFLVPLVVLEVIGLAVGHPVYYGIIGLFAGVLVALFVLTRRAERAAYLRLEGQPGAPLGALRSLRRGWTVEEAPVAVDRAHQDMVFRAVGRPGVVLTTDAPAHRAKRLLEDERRRTARVLPDVPLHLFQAGRGEGQVPLGKLPRTVMRLRPTLTAAEVAQVNKRLRALGGVRPPIPAGMDPVRARPDRRAVRGR